MPKNLSIREAVDLGVIQEINRLVLHPRGLELRVRQLHHRAPLTGDLVARTDDGALVLDSILDARELPEGLFYGDGKDVAPNADLADSFQRLLDDRAGARHLARGYVVQPVYPIEPPINPSVEQGKRMPKELK